MYALAVEMGANAPLAEKAAAFAGWGEATATPTRPMASPAWFAQAAPLLVVNPQAAALGLTILGTHYAKGNLHEIATRLFLKSYEIGASGDAGELQRLEAERLVARRRAELREEIERGEEHVRGLMARTAAAAAEPGTPPEVAALVQAILRATTERIADAKAELSRT